MSSWCYLVRDLLAVAPLGLSGPLCSPWVLPGCPQEGQYIHTHFCVKFLKNQHSSSSKLLLYPPGAIS